MGLPEHTSINKYAIELKEDKHSSYGPIYSLGLVELTIFKTYIKTHLKTGFICLSKSLAGTSIFFDRKQDGNLRLYVNHKGLNNLTIKNWYLLLLINKTLDWLGQTKYFTQIDLTKVYYQIEI